MFSKREERRLEEKRREEEFNNTTPICLNCKNAIIVKYISLSKDPLYVLCKEKVCPPYYEIKILCNGEWYIKVKECSEYISK